MRVRPAKVAVVSLVYLCVAALYLAFFIFPVSPAEPTDTFSYEVEERTYRALPNIHEMVYTNGKAFLAIATVRTISAPNSAYSAAFDRLDGYAENYARDQYGVEIEVREESRDDSFVFSGHTGVKFVFGIHKDMVVGFPPFETTQSLKVAELGAIAWFCNVDFESVILFYVTPLYFADDPSLSDLSSQLTSMVSEVRCH
ncbi:MAG: hypothetical protein A3K75_04295 [Euryarchaeota archaeon RBG_13_61_15]|nr:MAG: hypothetical protein A3K75_04295 [Euryarchaeota archaeon RBG_13_61_15]